MSAPSPRHARSSLRGEAGLVVLSLALCCAGVALATSSANQTAFLWLQQASATMPALWAACSVLGLGLSAALLAALAADDRMVPVATMLWSLLLGGIALQVFKHAWPEPRPIAVLPAQAVHVIGPRLRAGSMPSGHAAMLAALVVALVREAVRRRRAWLAPLVVVLGALACVARVMVGAHWPGDVLVGAAVGVLSVVVGDALDPRCSLQRWLRAPIGRRLFAIVQLAAAVVLVAMDTGYPSAVAVQWLLGGASVASAALRWRRAGRDRAAERWPTSASSR